MYVFCGGSELQALAWNHHAQGWHWYEELRQKGQLETQNVPIAQEPVQGLQAFKKKVEALKATAVMNPTFENVRTYMKIQKVLLEKSTRFA